MRAGTFQALFIATMGACSFHRDKPRDELLPRGNTNTNTPRASSESRQCSNAAEAFFHASCEATGTDIAALTRFAASSGEELIVALGNRDLPTSSSFVNQSRTR